MEETTNPTYATPGKVEHRGGVAWSTCTHCGQRISCPPGKAKYWRHFARGERQCQLKKCPMCPNPVRTGERFCSVGCRRKGQDDAGRARAAKKAAAEREADEVPWAVMGIARKLLAEVGRL